MKRRGNHKNMSLIVHFLRILGNSQFIISASLLLSVHSLSPSRHNSLYDLKPNSFQSGVRVDVRSPLTKDKLAQAVGQPHFVFPFSSKLFLHLRTGSTQISDVTLFWQKIYRAGTHFSLIYILGYLALTCNPSGYLRNLHRLYPSSNNRISQARAEYLWRENHPVLFFFIFQSNNCSLHCSKNHLIFCSHLANCSP